VRLSGRPAVAAPTLTLTACISSTTHAAPAPRPVSTSRVVSGVAVPGCSAASAPGRHLPAGLTRVLLMTDFASRQLETVNVANLP
jgi:hypothetical protein